MVYVYCVLLSAVNCSLSVEYLVLFCRYYRQMMDLNLHHKDYLAVSKNFFETYSTTSIKADEAKWKQVRPPYSLALPLFTPASILTLLHQSC